MPISFPVTNRLETTTIHSAPLLSRNAQGADSSNYGSPHRAFQILLCRSPAFNRYLGIRMCDRAAWFRQQFAHNQSRPATAHCLLSRNRVYKAIAGCFSGLHLGSSAPVSTSSPRTIRENSESRAWAGDACRAGNCIGTTALCGAIHGRRLAWRRRSFLRKAWFKGCNVAHPGTSPHSELPSQKLRMLRIGPNQRGALWRGWVREVNRFGGKMGNEVVAELGICIKREGMCLKAEMIIASSFCRVDADRSYS